MMTNVNPNLLLMATGYDLGGDERLGSGLVSLKLTLTLKGVDVVQTDAIAI